MEIAVNYEYRETDVRAALDVEALAAHVIRSEGMPENAEVSINFVTEGAIHGLNRDYRGVDAPTDVLSFECDGCDDDMPVCDDMSYELGDIVISVDRAEGQAPAYGLAFSDELSLLVTHGLLHLCGYDHMDEEEALEMEARERELLTKFWGLPFKRSAVDA